jgi:hypothetical protein
VYAYLFTQFHSLSTVSRSSLGRPYALTRPWRVNICPVCRERKLLRCYAMYAPGAPLREDVLNFSIQFYGWSCPYSLPISPKYPWDGSQRQSDEPRRLLPQPTPSLSYIGCPAKGRQAPKTERSIVAAAMAEAAYRVNASTR